MPPRSPTVRVAVPCQRYPRNLTITCASGPRRMKIRWFRKAEPSFWKPFQTLLSSHSFIVIGGGRRLTLRASKLSADGFGGPPNAGIDGLAVGRSVVVRWTRPLSFLFLCHTDAPSSGSIG